MSISFIEFNPNDYEIKLISVAKGIDRKSVKDFCVENKGETAVNGGLFKNSIISNKAEYIDGIYSSNGGLVNKGVERIPAIAFGKEGALWPDSFSSYENNSGISWIRNSAFYAFLLNGSRGCFSNGLETATPNGISEYNESKKRTMIGCKSNGNIVIACSATGMTGEQQGNYMQYVRQCIHGFNLDGGDSTQMYDNIQKKYILQSKSNRKVTDAIVIVKKSFTPPKPDISAKLKMKLTSSAVRLRTDIPGGTIKTTIPNGSLFTVVGLYSWKATDGYRWGWGEYGGNSGYFQYDPSVMNPVGNVRNERYKMRLFGSAARLRQIMRGTILTTVPNGSDINILEFIDGKQPDGYQWCYGSYGGTTGYFQYDPNVMFPTND